MIIGGIYHVVIHNNATGTLTFNSQLGYNICMISSVVIDPGKYALMTIDVVQIQSNQLYTINIDLLNATGSPYQPSSLHFSYNYIGGGTITEATVINNLPVLTLPGVLEITPIVNLTNLPVVDVIINAVFNEAPSYTDDFGLTFNIPNIVSFYNNNTSNLIFISSSHFPFSKNGSQFKSLLSPTLAPEFLPYFIPNTSLNNCFQDCTSFNSDINNWDTQNVTNMSYMFYNTPFNQPIGSWNTQSVTNMSYMFAYNTSFNQPIGSWNTQSVIDMSNMFYNTPFNQPIGSWNTQNVEVMYGMFGNTPFNQPIGSWNTQSVIDMSNMFNHSQFDQDISLWNTSNVLYMSNMFNSTQFNQPIGSWNTQSVIDMSKMFSENNSFNQDISLWNTQNVEDMSNMFYNNNIFNQDISLWNVSKVTNMSSMFEGATAFKQDISNWTPYACTNMTSMFLGCDINNPDSTDNQTNYNAILISWGIDKLADMQTNVTFNGGNSQYSGSAAITGRTNLTTTKIWNITDGGVV
jgi:surface protein